MKIGILGCDDVPERFRHLGGTYLDMFQRLLKPHLPDATFVWYDVLKGGLPASPDECDAYVCTGSRYSIYDEREWIGALKAHLRALKDARKPFVGICFGHQALAEALGGEVKKAEVGWGVGIHPMEVTAREPWMNPPQREAKLQYMHGDQVQKLPPESVVLAQAPHCPVAMFRVGETMLGIEGHPEFPASYVEALLRERKLRIGEETTEKALASLSQTADDDLVAQWMANFIRRHAERLTPAASR